MLDILHESIARQRVDIERAVFHRMREQNARSHPAIDEEKLQSRIAQLVDAFLESLQEGPQRFVDHIENISPVRIGEGVTLEELQHALQALEERSWSCVVATIPADDQVRCLGRITQTIGTAKDHIARTYLHHLKMAEMAMRAKHTGLGSADDDDLNWQRGWVHLQHEWA